MTHQIQCSCGEVQGEVDPSGESNRVICYCRDCQAFANHLRGDSGKEIKAESAILDDYGGTEIIQMSPSRIKFTQGVEQLRCLRLTEDGLLRWYASCCNTPLGNTIPNYKFSFVGLIHSCMRATDFEQSFGRVRARLSTQSAAGEIKAFGLSRVISFFVLRVLKNRLRHRYQNTPFFSREGEPIAEPEILADNVSI